MASYMVGLWIGSSSHTDVFDRDGLDQNINAGEKTKVSDDGIVRRPLGLKPLKNRYELGDLLEEMKFETGVEVGVQSGWNAGKILAKWPSCKRFGLVDLWAHQKNYKDNANVEQAEQDKLYQQAQDHLKPYKDKTEFLRMSSIEGAQKFDDNSLDFAYIDARHDYCGVKDDLNSYWPKIRPGGILAGHDFLCATEPEAAWQDFSICQDGTKNDGSVRGAVEEFALEHGLTVSVMYREKEWNSWMVQKPH